MPEEPHRAILGWAARLHEIGLAINYSGIHKHSAYILQNTDLPGFNQDDQALLAALVRFHRKGAQALRAARPAQPRRADGAALHPHPAPRGGGPPQASGQPAARVERAGRRGSAGGHPALDWCDENKLLMQNLEKEHRYCHEQGWPLLFQLG